MSFRSKSGELRVTRSGDRLTLDFPAWPPERREVAEALSRALGAAPREAWESNDVMAVYDSEDDVAPPGAGHGPRGRPGRLRA